MTARVLVLGLGNELCGDDGAGPRVIAELRRRGLPPGMQAEYGGTDSLRLVDLWRGEPAVWLVDAVQSGAPAGTLQLLEHDEVLALPQRHAGAHQLSLPENLRWMALTCPDLAAVRYRLWGIEAGAVGPQQEPSEAVAAAIPAAAAAVLAAFGRLETAPEA